MRRVAALHLALFCLLGVGTVCASALETATNPLQQDDTRHPGASTRKVVTESLSGSGAGSEGSLYTVEDGSSVDEKTLAGWKTWRALACERCHGAQQEGLVGPSLLDSLKVLTKEEFHTVLMQGRPQKGMPSFNTSPMVNKNWEGLYAYLKGRSDGKIKPGRLTALGAP